MKSLPIYPGYLPPLAEVERTEPLDRDVFEPVGRKHPDGRVMGRKCDRCQLGARVGLRNPCISATGSGYGGLLVVGEAPGKEEDTEGLPFTGRAGLHLRSLITKHWRDEVIFDTAIRCFQPGGPKKLKPKMFNECRPFLSAALEEVNPKRVIAVGAWAAFALFGRSIPPMTSRGAYSWLRGKTHPIPVFVVLTPQMAANNSFVRQWFEADMKRALTAPDPPAGPWKSAAHLIQTVEDAEKAERDLMSNDWIAFDVETMGRMWTPEFRMISCALVGDLDEEPWVWTEKALYDPAIRAPLERVLTSKSMGKVGSNVKYDQLAWRSAFNVCIGPIVGDTRLSRKLLDPEAAGKLSAMAELVGMGGLKQDAEDRMTEIESAAKRRIRKQWAKKNAKPLAATDLLVPGIKLHPQIDAALRAAAPEDLNDIADRYKYGMLPRSELVAYNARDSLATARVEHYVRDRMPEEPALERVWNALVLPGAQALEWVETWGIAASVRAIENFDGFLTVREQAVTQRLSAYPGVDWNSPDQVAELLFTKLKLPISKRTPTGKPSTDEEVLEHLKNRHPVCADLVEHRSVVKMKGTYASGMLPHIRPDGRIHPNIKLDGARSGRTSCVDPNLQNIPRAKDTQEGKMARDCFIAPRGFRLVEVDYGQLELRVAALLSQDPVMIQIFNSGIDYHLRTAQLISHLAWGIKPEEVEDKHRSLAKSVNFGILYGKTSRTLAQEWGVSIQKADTVVAAIMGQFKVLDKWCNARRSEALRTGEVWTYWNGEPARRRPLYRIGDRGNDAAVSTARNGAVNSPIQGTASDYCVASLIEVVDWIRNDGLADDVKLVLAVHDALMLEVREPLVDEVAHTLHEIMTHFPSGNVPLEVDFKVGQAWGSMQSYKLAA